MIHALDRHALDCSDGPATASLPLSITGLGSSRPQSIPAQSQRFPDGAVPFTPRNFKQDLEDCGWLV